jgi:alanine-synthesizing transaminase
LPLSGRSDLGSGLNELAVALAARRARGDRVLDLTQSNPTVAGIPYAEADILAALTDRASLVYEPTPFGLDRARRAVAELHGTDPRRVLLTASTSEAYAFLFKLLCDPGDAVLAPQPSYPLLEHLAHLESVRLVPYRLRYDGAWHTDLASAREAAGASRARAILAVSPNNPTGSCLDRSELDALAALAPVVCDEVFAPYVFRERGERVACAATAARDGLVFSLGGLSKLAALPQMKLAWVIAGGDDRLVEAALERLEIIADAFLSVSTPVQHATERLLASASVAQAAVRARLRENLALLDAELAGTAQTRLDVEGGWYAIVRLPAVRPEAELVLDLLEAGVYVHPGSFFGFEDEPYVVVSLLTSPATFAEGVRALRRT